MRHFSYKLDHDYGLAPNPFGRYCTLAVCKSSIRRNRNLEIGSWIFGSGSKKVGLNKLIYAMQVSEIITFNEYWNDPRFQYKKPKINGPLVQIYGDNIYYQDSVGRWFQANSAHSKQGGALNQKHLERDTGGEKVLVSTNFYYFGDKAIILPVNFVDDIFCDGRDMRSPTIIGSSVDELVEFLSQFKKGINGDPIDWKVHLR